MQLSKEGTTFISRQVAIESLGERPMSWTDSDYEIAQRNQYDCDKLAIETVPAADVRENVRGEWIVFDKNYTLATCSQCKKITMFETWGNKVKFYDFCPNCGSDMRGEKK